MKCFRQKGFTLVELMVVIAIISILAAALITSFSKIQNGARATKCKANLRALAQATQSYGVAGNHFPAAGSYEWVPATTRKDPIWRVRRGWVAWTQGSGPGWPWGAAPTDSDQKKSDLGHDGSYTERVKSMSLSICYGDAAYISLTNGALWGLIGRDSSVYVCSAHKSITEPLFHKKVYRSYIMNGFFKYWDNDHNEGGEEHRVEDILISGRAANLLMFAELPAHGASVGDRRFTGSALKYDKMEDKEEEDGWNNGERHAIGFNHLIAKRWVGHVAFTDGHVEGLVLPSKAKENDAPKYDHKDIRNLTGLLCNGREITSTIRETMK